MDLSPVLARLKANLAGLRSVGTVADLESAFAGQVAVPSAFLMPLGEAALDMGLLSSTAERVVQSFAVVHAISNRRDAQGGAAMDDLAVLRQNLRVALVGWVPDIATGEAVRFTSGRLLQMDGDGRLWWMDEFELVFYYWSA